MRKILDKYHKKCYYMTQSAKTADGCSRKGGDNEVVVLSVIMQIVSAIVDIISLLILIKRKK